MSRVDFAFGASHRLRMACDVVRKQYLAGRRIVVFSRDAQSLARFDRLLWGFDAAAFVPHVMADDPLANETPVVLCSALPLPPGLTAAPSGFSSIWLLNLDADCPPEANAFERILEIVSNDDHDKAMGRARWRAYQAAGHDVRAHDVSGR